MGRGIYNNIIFTMYVEFMERLVFGEGFGRVTSSPMAVLPPPNIEAS